MPGITLFYRLPRLTILLVLVTFISGFFAILTLGRQEDPTLVERYGQVLTTLPGADAERIEATVTEPIERRLRELAEVKTLKSSSRANVSNIDIDLLDELTPTEVDNAWTLVRQQVSLAQTELPEGTSIPAVRRYYVGANTIIVGLTWTGQGEPQLAVMTRLAQILDDRLKNLNATEETEFFGLPREEVRVIMDPNALAAADLSLAQAAGLIAGADAKTPAGTVRGSQVDLGIEIGGAFDGIARVRSVPLLQRADGSALRVGDVAEVVKAVEDPPRVLALSNGRRTIMVTASIQPNQRVDLWAENARAIVDDFTQTVPEDIAVELLFDQSVYTDARLNGLAMSLAQASLLVFVVLFFIMGWRSALVVGLALPLTIALVLMLFQFFQYPLHQMSVTGLVISLGLLIDNAIVVVDEYEQERAGGRTILEAIDHSIGKLFGPLFASTLTTALAFAPIAFLAGPTGEFIGMLGVSVIFSVCASFVVAITIMPAIAGWMDHPRDPDTPKRWWRDGITLSVVSDGYRWTVERVLRFPLLGLLIGIVPVLIGFRLGAGLPTQFFPPTERDQFQLEISLSAQATIDEAIVASQQVTDMLLEYEDVEGVYFSVGGPGPVVYYNSVSGADGVPGYANGFVRLKDSVSARGMISEVQRRLRADFPKAQILAVPFEQGPPVDAPVAFFISGDDLSVLNDLGNQARQILAEIPGVTFTQAKLELGAPIVTIRADEAATGLSGERLTALANDIRSELEGIPAGTILEGIEEVPVLVIASDDRRRGLSDLRGKTIGNDRPGDGTPLAALGEITLDPQTASIIRYQGRRVNEIYAFLDPYALPDPVFDAFQAALADSDFELPPGYELLISGTAETQSTAINGLLALAVPLCLIMLGAVALVFNSFRKAILIMSIGVMAIGLAFGGVSMFNLPLGFNAIVGALGLLGIAINGSIVVLALLDNNAAARADDIIAQREVVVSATRHIVATTLTTMGGFVPIIMTGDIFWMPLATAIAGGVAGSALLALYFTPAVFRLMTMQPLRRSWVMLRGGTWQQSKPVSAE
ncbi:MAG: efflux RND transporter permease subunit [Pseudomonadota bacterium]